jgi:predicted transposase YbfD/YdcC
VNGYGNLPDPRIDRCKLHILTDIVTIAVCAIISNADGAEDSAAYGRAKEPLLRRFLDLSHGIPSRDTFERVFARLDPSAFQRCFLNWAAHIRSKCPGEVVAIDGKTACGTRDAPIDLAPLHMVSAWAAANALVLGQLRTPSKSNEITAIPLLLDILDIQGCIVTIDAMGCQTAIVEKIVEKNADYVITCKGNQGHLHADIETLFAQLFQETNELTDLTYHQSSDEHHGRREVREYWSTAQIASLRGKERWRGLQSVAMVRSQRQTSKGIATETRYLISSLPNDAQRIGQAVRTHWTIENQLHWVLDVVFHEDDSRLGSHAQVVVVEYRVGMQSSGGRSHRCAVRTAREHRSSKMELFITASRNGSARPVAANLSPIQLTIASPMRPNRRLISSCSNGFPWLGLCA